ncbi:MAG: Formamidopyrimidine-DNA glycosylase [Labilithrix sp.]|nr:Formamidopyrimidine-DNA glycosylase [Labilithrix sp.]
MLEQWLGGSTIVSAHVHDARILDEGVTTAKVQRRLRDRAVLAVERRGKWLRVPLAPSVKGGKGPALFSHLGMTGKWVLAARPDDEPLRFEKARLDLALPRGRRRSVRYLDPRLFGRFVVPDEDLPIWSALGPDPLVDGIDARALHARLQTRRLAVKPVLLDQAVLAGIGNIYATEALFAARIDPRRPANGVTLAETKRLAKGLDEALALSIARNTEERITYVEEPGAANPFVVYGHEGEPCPRCRRPLAKMVLAGRGTVFCPHCQR